MKMLRMRIAAILVVGQFCGLANSQTTSPFQPPEQRLGSYVVNSGSGLDTGCTYRSGGPLLIRLNIPKVVNDNQLKADGTLKNAAELVRNKVLSAQATVRFPVFDIDDKAVTSGFSSEIDRISFNGKFKKILSGFNNTWTDDSIIVPIEELRFGQDNELRIDIDTANAGGGEYWCMAVDWLAVEFDVTPPYVLAHGISANRTTWESSDAVGVIAKLDSMGVLYNRFSLGTALDGNGSAASNAGELNTQVRTWLNSLKADKVHVIAHSKGGLDTQYLQSLAPTFSIVSLSTLSTPHLGSVAADLSVVQITDADDRVASGADPNGYVAAYLGTWTFGQGPQLPGLRDLTTYAASAAINSGLRNNIANTFTIGANADADGNNELSSAEILPLFPSGTHYAAKRAWQVLRDFSTVTLTTTLAPGRFWGMRTVLTYTILAQPVAQANDIVVTQKSANPSYGNSLGNVLANHSSVKSGANIGTILVRTIPIKQ